MENANLGWILAIVIGGLSGLAAQYVMKSKTGILLNIILGILGSILANFVFSLFGVSFVGWVGYLVSGFIGACILIWIGQKARSKGI